jgi:hypothetical protein
MMILKEMGWIKIPASIDDPSIPELANMLAIGFIQAKENPDKKSEVLNQALIALENIRGEDDIDDEWGNVFYVQRD